ncbi:MAG: monovalent cation:proton antiporter-2 (CPA2) family protein [Stenotrophomonas sp.]
MAAEQGAGQLLSVVALLAGAVVAVPLFRRLGLGSVLGYFAAGLMLGPFGLGWFADPQAILHLAELGVVLFLFLIGLEMRPSHLWSLRRQIFGLGSAQILGCTMVLTGICRIAGLSWPLAFIAAAGFVLTSTAVVMQLLGERGQLSTRPGQQIVSILLFEDLLIVPLLALAAWMAPASGQAEAAGGLWQQLGLGVLALVLLLAAGRWLLDPLFALLAHAGAREVMTAAALLVVLGAALLMQWGGLSMAMGAFVAGVLLSESAFRHQLQAEIEPFRGLLLGLFFLGVGMALDLAVVAGQWRWIGALVLALMLAKAGCVWLVARLCGSSGTVAAERAVLMAQGGEFAFVLYAAAAASGLLDARLHAQLTAVVVLSMALTPLAVLLHARLRSRRPTVEGQGLEGPQEQLGQALVIGFGRVGQVVSQALLARGTEVTIIDADPDMIRAAQRFGLRIYYGDGTRLDVLRACGIEQAALVVICVDGAAQVDQVLAQIRVLAPQVAVVVRAWDRGHACRLAAAGVDMPVRETFESALRMGAQALQALGDDAGEAAQVIERVRELDAQRLALEVALADPLAGNELLFGNAGQPQPVPFTRPQRDATRLDPQPDQVQQRPDGVG